MNSRKRNAYSMPISSSSSTSTPNEFSNSAKLFVRHQNNRRFVAANDSSNDESSTANDSPFPAVSRKRHVALDENVPMRAANDESHSSTSLGAAADMDTNSIYSNVYEKRRRRFAPAIVDDDDVTNDDDDDDDNDPVINGEALAAAVINDVELDQPNMQLVPYQRFAWQEPIVLGDRRIVTSRLKPSMLQLSPAYPLLVRQTPVAASADDADSSSDIDSSSHNVDIDINTNVAVGNDVDDALAAISEPPSPWALMPIGGHGDGTRQFFELLSHAARLSIVRVVPDDSTPLELLQSVDSWSPSFAQASSFLQQNAMSFPNLNLNFAYEGTSGASRQLVVASNVTQNALWPTAAAFNRETNELVILVSGNRRQFPWAKVAQAFE